MEKKKNGYLIIQVKEGTWITLGDGEDRVAVKQIRRGSVRLIFNAPNLRIKLERGQNGKDQSATPPSPERRST